MFEVSPISWPWYIAGPLLGLFVPLLAFFVNKQLGVSSGFRAFWSLFTKKPAYFNYDSKKDIWQLFFGFGLLLAGLTFYFLGGIPAKIPITAQTVSNLQKVGISDFSGVAPTDIYGLKTWWILILGGISIGLGARLGNGCTAGHCIMGISQLSLSSMITTFSFFIGGLIATYFVIPFLL